jgi:hypothetical protein
MDQKPSIGRIVLFRTHASNGALEHPAIITRVWSDTCVNLSVFPDFGEPQPRTSVNQNESLDGPNQDYAWRWPPRVS